MSREFLRAYLKAQRAHKDLHRLLKAFEEDLPDSVLLERIKTVKDLLKQIEETIRDD